MRTAMERFNLPHLTKSCAAAIAYALLCAAMVYIALTVLNDLNLLPSDFFDWND